MPALEVVPFADEHLDAAAELLAARHARQREAEPLLRDDVDFRAELEAEWRQEGASGVFAGDAYLIGAPQTFLNVTWLRVWIAGQAIAGDRERMRDLYAAAAERWVDEGYRQHAVLVPVQDRELVDAWFRLSFGASSALALRQTTPEEQFDAGLSIRPGTPDDFADSARLE
ncbi:MAG TPA: hypothetical protein VE757_01435, partial [Gaiellaceae bacterium]|nr:hypothetical protein [Gaiellaceae bacterium]